MCPRCGFAPEAGARFCGGCGQAIAAPAPIADRFASPDAYTPPDLAEKIRTARGAVEGERKQVTVLFADMKGSLELLADRDPEDARRMLDPVLALMMEAVHRYEGTVNQVLGDGIMAIFGAPVAHENHVVRAAYAALRMHEGVVAWPASCVAPRGSTCRSASGSTRARWWCARSAATCAWSTPRSARRRTWPRRWSGSPVPARRSSPPRAARLAEGYIAVTPLGPVPVRGTAEPIEVYELTGPGPARYRLQAATVRGLSASWAATRR